MLYLEQKLWSKDLPPVLPTLLIPLHLIAASLTYVQRKLCCQLGKFFSFSDGKCHNKSSVSAVGSQICFLFRLCFFLFPTTTYSGRKRGHDDRHYHCPRPWDSWLHFSFCLSRTPLQCLDDIPTLKFFFASYLNHVSTSLFSTAMLLLTNIRQLSRASQNWSFLNCSVNKIVELRSFFSVLYFTLLVLPHHLKQFCYPYPFLYICNVKYFYLSMVNMADEWLDWKVNSLRIWGNDRLFCQHQSSRVQLIGHLLESSRIVRKKLLV